MRVPILITAVLCLLLLLSQVAGQDRPAAKKK